MMVIEARESWLSEVTRNFVPGSEDNLSWLLTTATLYPSNLEAAINLFRVLKSQKKSEVAALLLSRIIPISGSSEIVSLELKVLSEDSDEERYCNLLASARNDEVEKLEEKHRLSCFIISKLPPDIQAVVKLKSVGITGLSNLSKRADILCSALTDSYDQAVVLSDAFVTSVCADLLGRLLESPSRELRKILCEKVLPILFRTKASDSFLHPILKQLPLSLLLKCLIVYIGHVLITSFNVSTASMVSIDRQWQPCLMLVNKILFSSLNCNVPSVFSDDDGVDPQPPTSLDRLTFYLLNLQDRFIESQCKDESCDTLAIMTVLGLLRNTTAYLRSILHPAEGEKLRPVIMPSLKFIASCLNSNEANCDIKWAGSEDPALASGLISAFNIWSYLMSISPSSSCVCLPRRIHEIFGEISNYFNEENPLKFLDQFRVETIIFKQSFDQAVAFFDPNSSVKAILAQRIMCLAACGRIRESAVALLEVQTYAGSEKCEDECELKDYASEKCFLFTPISPATFSQMTVSILLKSLETAWPLDQKSGSSHLPPCTILLLSQIEAWPSRATICCDILEWLFANFPKPSTTSLDLSSQVHTEAFLQLINSCVFRPELLEFVLKLISSSVQQVNTAEVQENSSNILANAIKCLQTQLSSVCILALKEPHTFALTFIRSNTQSILSFISQQ